MHADGSEEYSLHAIELVSKHDGGMAGKNDDGMVVEHGGPIGTTTQSHLFRVQRLLPYRLHFQPILLIVLNVFRVRICSFACSNYCLQHN